MSKGSSAAVKGTALHAEAAEALEAGDFDNSAYTKWVAQQGYDSMLVESKVDCGMTSGTADCILYDSAWKRPPMIVDLKTGFVEVEAHENKQLALYAYGFLKAHNKLHLGAFGTIFQFGKPDTYYYTPSWLITVVDQVRWAMANPELHRAGDVQCRYCPHKINCAAFEQHYLTAIEMKTLEEKFARIEMIRKWCDEVEAEAYEAYDRGELKGYALVEGRNGARRWKDGAEKELESQGLTIYKKVLKSPAEIEKEFKVSVSELTYQPKTKAKLKCQQ